jgi:cation diffusion facilitator family transporter
MSAKPFTPTPMSPQKRATVVSTSVAALLTLFKLLVGIASGSVAVLASAIDSLLDMAVSLFNFFAIRKAEERPNERFPYGKGKIQAIAGVIEGTVITLSGIFIIYKALQKFFQGETTTYLGTSLLVMLFSLVVTYWLVRYLLRIAEETDNIVIKSDALHYKTDLLSNGAVLIALVLVWITGWDWLDALFGLGIGIYIIYSAYAIIYEGIMILLDQALPGHMVAAIGEIIGSHPKVNGYHWLKTRTDSSANYVEFHLVLEPKMTLEEAHHIAEEIEDRIVRLDPGKGWAITPHFDPYDDEHINELMFAGDYTAQTSDDMPSQDRNA